MNTIAFKQQHVSTRRADKPRARCWLPIRIGTTLTEVLMALLVTGIGLSSLATLFPLSILRSVQANQLTVGTQHRFTAEALLDLYPQLFADPDNDANFAEHANTRFIVDPLGRAKGLPAALGSLNRFDGGFTTEAYADKICTSPDSWVTQMSGLASASTSTSVTLPNLINQNLYLNGPSVRVILFNDDQSASQIRYITEMDSSGGSLNNNPIDSNTLNWEDSLPTNFGSVGEVRVETEERRFTWMLTVRGQDSSVSPYGYDVDVVIFFRRSFETVDEPEFELTTTRGSRTATVSWASGTGKPYLKKGGYVLDAGTNGANWYRIADYDASSITNGMTIVLSNPAVRTTSKAPAFFLKGIVDVYPVGSKSSP